MGGFSSTLLAFDKEDFDMPWLEHFFYMMLHLDLFLAQMVHMFGVWSYVILFVVVFFERGCILTPFLPGDSLLFAAGALAASSELDILVLMLILTAACFLGVLINYWLGYRLRDYINLKNPRWINRDHLKKAHVFFEKYGISAIIVCCFIPIIRTFTPFVAGMAEMSPRKYIAISLFSSCIWIISVLWISYAFGNMPFVQEHFSWFVLAMIVIPSAIPLAGVIYNRYKIK